MIQKVVQVKGDRDSIPVKLQELCDQFNREDFALTTVTPMYWEGDGGEWGDVHHVLAVFTRD